MALDDALDELKMAFDKVAHEMEQAHPDVWNKLEEWYGCRSAESKVQMMRKSPSPHIPMKSLLEAVEEKGDEAIIRYIDRERQGMQIRIY